MNDHPVFTEGERCEMAGYRSAQSLTNYSNAATLSNSRCTKTPAEFAAALMSSKLSFRLSIVVSKFLLLIRTSFEGERMYSRESDFKHSSYDANVYCYAENC